MTFSAFDGKVDEPKNMFTFLFESLVFGLSGLLLGSFIDVQFKKLTQKFPKHRNVIAFVQLILLILIVGIMYLLAKNTFALHFQQTLPGMAFPAMYFGVQSNLFETSEKIFTKS